MGKLHAGVLRAIWQSPSGEFTKHTSPSGTAIKLAPLVAAAAVLDAELLFAASTKLAA